jgi:2-methylcitrate dehydratase PrpD
MSHAEALHVRHPAAGATEAITGFVGALRYASLSEEVRHYARRHLFDTVGVMIAGAGGEVATRAEAVLAGVRPAGSVPVPGRARRADLIDAAFLGGTAAHGIELDDGYTKGSVHPGCAVIPSALAVGYAKGASGKDLIEAVVAGYETVTAIGRACHPALRHRGFHPTGAVSVFGAAMTTGKLRGLSGRALGNALGIAASSSAGLFAFVNGGADIKRLHAGHAAREGVQAALLAEQGVEGPPGVIEARDGFMQAFAYAQPEEARPITLPPEGPFGMTDCYIKPNPCCRHIQPATEALIALLKDEGIATEEVKHIAVETYRIAAEHAATGWEDFASSQLSFRYLMALALNFRAIRFQYFEESVRRDPSIAALAKPDGDLGAHRDRPALPAAAAGARDRNHHARQVHAAGRRGARLAAVPFDDDGLKGKFLGAGRPCTARAGEATDAQVWTSRSAPTCGRWSRPGEAST